MDILLEIGVEEIPARFIKTALEDMKKSINKSFDENRMVCSEVSTYGTPRRLTLKISNMKEFQDDIRETNIGPSRSVAYTENGEPTKAAIGFANSQGVEIKDLSVVKTEKGEYIAAERFVKGQENIKMLPEILKNTITGLTFKKSMKWGKKTLRFVRPIRWIVALANNEVIDFEIEGIKAGRITFGNRFFGEGKLEISNVLDYFEKISKNFVILDMDKRREKIVELVKEKFSKVNEKILMDDDLLDEITNLVEYPYPIMGTFNTEFLEIPQEVIILTMKKNQKYFPVVDENGKLLPKFVVIRNGNEGSENIKKGNEKVLEARLSDARFFYYEDLKTPIEKMVEKLKNVVFYKELGSIYDKLERTKHIARNLCEKLNYQNEEKQDILRTTHLLKFDLVSQIVSEKEYTSLQGFMGKVYANKSGEKENVSQGILEHYMPKFQGDTLPKTKEGIINAISDKIDTVVGCFGIGLIPTGSQDPYALRRATQGVVSILWDARIDISIFDLIDITISAHNEKNRFILENEKLIQELGEFFKNRIINIFQEKGYKKDMVEAVVKADFENILDIEKRLEVIKKIGETKDFTEIVEMVKRLKNISKDFSDINIKTYLFKEKEEKDLYDFYENLSEKAIKNIEERNYEAFFSDILNGKNIINNFFDNIMIMDKNEKIRENRLSLVKSIENICNKVVKITDLGESVKS